MKPASIPALRLLASASAALLLGGVFTPSGASAAGSAATPNIVFIMADDLGYTDVACYGSKYFPTAPKTEYPKGQYLADFLTDRAVDFLQRHKNERFFLYLPHFGVHSPHQAKPELIAKFKDKPGVGGHNNPTYAAMIASIDESVGRVMAKLDELELTDNTVLIFTSDNGGVGGLRREGIESGNITDNAPLRGGKGSLYEGGTRIPFIVRWPGKVKPGSTCDAPSIHVDIYPTFTALAGGRLPEKQILDGENLVPLWLNPNAKLKREAIYQHFPGYLGAGGDTFRTMPVSLIQAGDWKLMEFIEDGRIELYNLRDDIGESRNLAASQPERAKELHGKLLAWRAAIKAPMPTPNPNVKATGEKKQRKGKKAQKQRQNSAASLPCELVAGVGVCGWRLQHTVRASPVQRRY